MRLLRFALFLIAITPGCGVNVCAMGFGQCESMFGTPPESSSTTTSTGSLTISGASEVTVGFSETYTASGGNGSYTFSVSPTTCGSFVATTFTASAAGTCTLFVVDTNTTPLSGSATITVNP